MKIIILGSGTSTGVPVIGCKCPVCKSTDKKDKRTRASIAVIPEGSLPIVIDTAPEFRLQVLDAGITRVENVLYTHLHADHTHGFDDLRAFTFFSKTPIKLWIKPDYIEDFKQRFNYAFVNTGYRGAKPKVIIEQIPEHNFYIGDQEVEPIVLEHGHIMTTGFRFGEFAYVTDFKRFPDQILQKWRGSVRVLVASGIHFGAHDSHSTVPETVELMEKLWVEKGYISHLAHDVDYKRDSARLPDHIKFAFDGMMIDV